LGGGNLAKGRRETVEVETFVTIVAENDVVGISLGFADLASLSRRGASS